MFLDFYCWKNKDINYKHSKEKYRMLVVVYRQNDKIELVTKVFNIKIYKVNLLH